MTRYCIAVPTENGHTISPHFGRAPKYVVFTVEEGRIMERREVPKPTHTHSPAHAHDHRPGAHLPMMLAPVQQCRVFILGGIGRPGYEQLIARGYEVYLTGGSIEDAVQAYLQGHLSSDLRRIHQPHHP